MKTLFLLLLVLAPAALSQQPTRDTSRFTQAKAVIAQRVLKQMKARLAVCDAQPPSKRALCAEWAKASNDAATDVELTAFAEIDKLAQAESR
ncbi:MAG TPA: hypothetical protein VHU89_00850 [Acidobacteriaceae bacterium]|jgi:hypothetical protein|nr:hypothetical protein [Acidobacteriaceae bacterium]